MAIETATYISDLNPANPDGSNSTKAELDNHIRLMKQVELNTWQNITGAVTTTHTNLNKVGVTQAQSSNDTSPASTAFVHTAVTAAGLSSALPGQTGNAGKYVTTDGTTASWATIDLSQYQTAGITTIASGSLPAAATLDIINIPATYAYLVLQVTGMSSGGTGIIPRVQVSTNNGGAFDTTAANYPAFYVNNATLSALGAASMVQRSSMTAAETTDLTVVIFGYQAGPHKKFQGRASDGTNVNEVTGTYVGSTSAIDALRIGWSGAGNFDGGTYALYGVA